MNLLLFARGAFDPCQNRRPSVSPALGHILLTLATRGAKRVGSVDCRVVPAGADIGTLDVERPNPLPLCSAELLVEVLEALIGLGLLDQGSAVFVITDIGTGPNQTWSGRNRIRSRDGSLGRKDGMRRVGGGLGGTSRGLLRP